MILRARHQAVDDALARGDPALDEQLLAKPRKRYDEAVTFGICHNRLRDWHEGTIPATRRADSRLRDYKQQVRPFTTQFAVDWTNNFSKQSTFRPGLRPEGMAPSGQSG